MRELAESISASSKGRIVLGTVSLNRFANAFPNIFISHAHALKWADTAFLASLHDPSGIFEQISFAWTLPKLRVRSLSIVLPYFPTATMERVVRLGEVATAKTLAKMLSATPLTQRGPARVVLCDLHTLQNEFYFDDTVTPQLLTAVPLLLARLRSPSFAEKSKGRGIAIVFPDDGARKRYAATFADAATFLGQDVEIVTCAKDRGPSAPTPTSVTGAVDGADTAAAASTALAAAAAAAAAAATAAATRVCVREGDCSGRMCVIMDDLVRSGGTLEAAAHACWAAGACGVAVFSVHCVFEGGAWQRFVDSYNHAAAAAAAAAKSVGEAGAEAAGEVEDEVRWGQPPRGVPLISPFWITDSHPMAASLRGKAPFEVLSLAPLLRDAILDE